MNAAAAALDALAAYGGHRAQAKARTVASLVALLVTVAVQVATAATIAVNTTADSLTPGDGLCTLREALANVNASTDTTSGDCAAGTGLGDTVTFNLTLPTSVRSTTIKLKLGELVLQRDVTIIGPTTIALHVSGAHVSRIFRVVIGTTASMSNLTLEHGAPLNRVLEGGLEYGGAIVNSGTITLTDCNFTSNKAQEGGAIYNVGGGGIFNDGVVSLTNCTLKGNRAYANAGGIANNGTMNLTNCALIGNLATVGPGGGHLGGGIENNGGTMSLTNCTLSGNIASGGGGIDNESASSIGTMTLTNCTLTGNRTYWTGGGAIKNQGAMTVTNCTIGRNNAVAGGGDQGGGGIWHSSFNPQWTATLTNTIIAGNGKKAGNCAGDPITSNGHNLTDAGCFAGGGTDIVGTDPILAPLGSYGGPTKTMALCSGAHIPSRSCTGASPAIDGGDDAVIGPPLNLTTDQRGLPRASGAHVDIGAYEAQ